MDHEIASHFSLHFTEGDATVKAVTFSLEGVCPAMRRILIDRTIKRQSVDRRVVTLSESDGKPPTYLEPDELLVANFYRGDRERILAIAAKANLVSLRAFERSMYVFRNLEPDFARQLVHGITNKPFYGLTVYSPDENDFARRATYVPYLHTRNGLPLSTISGAAWGPNHTVIIKGQ